jgi:hypothetical protein
MMGGPGPDMMYGGMDSGMMGVSAGARMYSAASPKPGPGANGMHRGGGVPKSGSSSDLDVLGGGGGAGNGGAGGGNWVQIMDPDGKVYLVNQAAGGGGNQ